MTSIEKLSIRGIRSYSPNSAQVIQFDKPLTLIVGKNGCGKTTVIEAMKMACTGDLPPNCKSGQAFINDPSLHDQTEVKAQIRLKFTSLIGQPVVCVRSFSLTQKATKKEYKAFESALQTFDSAGNKQCLSYKCADLNKLVPEMMGVSQAVLESVIFVHQEESCWPLSEDKVLKEKFDAIFASTKFTKALDEINKYKKAKKTEEKVLNAEFGQLDEALHSVNKLRTEETAGKTALNETNGLIAKRRDEIEGLRGRLTPLLQTRSQKAQLKQSERELEMEHRAAMGQRSTAKAKLTQVFGRELQETDDFLQRTRQDLGAHEAAMRDKVSSLKAERETTERNVERCEEEKEAARANMARLEASMRTLEAAERECKATVERLCGTYDLAAVRDSSRPAAERAEAALAKLEQELARRQKALADCKATWQSTIGRAHEQLSELRAKLSGVETDARKRQQDAAALERRKAELAERLEALAQDESRHALLRRELSSIRQELEEKEAALQGDADGAVQQQLRAKKHEVRECKDKQRSLEDEMQQADEEGDRRQRLDRLKAAAREGGEKLDAAVNAGRAKLQRLLNVGDVLSELAGNNLGKKHAVERRRREDECAAKEDEVAAAERDLNRLSAQAQIASRLLGEKRDERETLEKALADADPRFSREGFDFEKLVEDAKKGLEDVQAEATEGASMGNTVEKCLAFSQRTKKCRVCAQPCDDAALRSIETFLKRTRDAASSGAEVQGGKLREAEREMERAQRSAENAKKVRTLGRSEIPALTDKAGADREALRSQQARLDELRAERDSLKKAEQEVLDLRVDVAQLKQLHDEKAKLDEDVAAATSSAVSTAYGMARAKEEIKAELDETRDALDKAEKRLEALEKNYSRRVAERDDALRRKSAKEVEFAKLETEVSKKQAAQEQLEELSAKQAGLKREADEIGRNEAPMREKERTLSADLDRSRAAERSEVAAADERVTGCQRDTSRLSELASRLREQRGQRLEETYHRASETFAEATKRLDEEKASAKAKAKELEETRHQQASKEKLQSEVLANLEYRETANREAEKQKELDAVRQSIRDLPGGGAVEPEIDEVQASINKKELEIQRSSGAVETIGSRLKETRTQLNEHRYRHIDDRHAKKLIEVKTVSLVIGDLDRYYKALDRALIRFHQTKMEEINRSTKELWNKTYKGSDIDGIEIKSEHEGRTDSGAVKSVSAHFLL